MKYEEFTRQLGKAGLKIVDFAKLLKITPSSVSNYREKGEVPKYLAVIASLFGEMAEKGIDYKSIILNLDLQPNKSKNKGRIIKKKTDI